jgi:hypothetical protein
MTDSRDPQIPPQETLAKRAGQVIGRFNNDYEDNALDECCDRYVFGGGEPGVCACGFSGAAHDDVRLLPVWPASDLHVWNLPNLTWIVSL